MLKCNPALALQSTLMRTSIYIYLYILQPFRQTNTWEMVSLTFFTAGSLFWKKVLLITIMGYCPTVTVGAWFHRASHRKWDPAAELIVAIPDNVCDAEKHAKGCLGDCSRQCFAWNTRLLLHWQRACFNRQSWPNRAESEMQMRPMAQTKQPFRMCNCLSQPDQTNG